MIKLHFKPHSFVLVNGERWATDFDHWTTVENYLEGIKNIRIDIARKELFVKGGIGAWTNIVLDDEVEIIPVN